MKQTIGVLFWVWNHLGEVGTVLAALLAFGRKVAQRLGPEWRASHPRATNFGLACASLFPDVVPFLRACLGVLFGTPPPVVVTPNATVQVVLPSPAPIPGAGSPAVVVVPAPTPVTVPTTPGESPR